jgi:hypothetical protein
VKRTLEWSKIIFGERNGFWATAHCVAKSEFFRDFEGKNNCERRGIRATQETPDNNVLTMRSFVGIDEYQFKK